MDTGSLGKLYHDQEVIIRQGEEGNCMYVIQEGQVEIIQEEENCVVQLAVLKEGDFFGEMAIFEKEVRSASVRALGEVRVLTIDQKNFMRRIHQDPSLAFRVVRTMSRRIREMNRVLVNIKSSLENAKL